MATTGAASPPDEPARDAKTAMPQPAKTTTSRAGRDLRAAILVGAGIGAVLVVTLVFAPHYWVLHCAWAAAVASHEVVRRLREAGYVVPLIPLLVGGQATVWLTWPYHAAGALAGFGGSVRTGSPSKAESPRPSPRGLNSLIALRLLPAPIRLL